MDVSRAAMAVVVFARMERLHMLVIIQVGHRLMVIIESKPVDAAVDVIAEEIVK
jgi:hypothetical protein